MESRAGTHRWMAPELFLDANVNIAALNLRAADVFSYAMLLYEIWEHKTPFDNKRSQMAMLAVVEKQRPATSKKNIHP